MATSRIQYKGNLRAEAEHLASGEVIVTDAPIDNKGKGEAFSPTDLLATSLASCMITVMAIHAQKNSLPFERVNAQVTKIMGSEPRRIATIEVRIDIDGTGLTESQRNTLSMIARNCPVALSLSQDLVQKITVSFT